MSVVRAKPIVEAERCAQYQENGGLDFWYAFKHSLRVDSRIIVKTIMIVITGRGAY